jgi:AraC family transcriptional regulator
MKISTQEYYAEKISLVLGHIRQRLDDPLEPEELARLVNMAVFHFYKVFRLVVGQSLQCYIRSLRLYRAADQLTASDQTILDIAVAANYQSHEAFTRAFKRAFGVTPSIFRSQARGLRGGGEQRAA